MVCVCIRGVCVVRVCVCGCVCVCMHTHGSKSKLVVFSITPYIIALRSGSPLTWLTWLYRNLPRSPCMHSNPRGHRHMTSRFCLFVRFVLNVCAGDLSSGPQVLQFAQQCSYPLNSSSRPCTLFLRQTFLLRPGTHQFV